MRVSVVSGLWFGCFELGGGQRGRPCQCIAQVCGSFALSFCDVRRFALCDDLTAANTCFGADFDDPVGNFKYVDIMLNDDERVARID